MSFVKLIQPVKARNCYLGKGSITLLSTVFSSSQQLPKCHKKCYFHCFQQYLILLLIYLRPVPKDLTDCARSKLMNAPWCRVLRTFSWKCFSLSCSPLLILLLCLRGLRVCLWLSLSYLNEINRSNSPILFFNIEKLLPHLLISFNAASFTIEENWKLRQCFCLVQTSIG